MLSLMWVKGYYSMVMSFRKIISDVIFTVGLCEVWYILVVCGFEFPPTGHETCIPKIFFNFIYIFSSPLSVCNLLVIMTLNITWVHLSLHYSYFFFFGVLYFGFV